MTNRRVLPQGSDWRGRSPPAVCPGCIPESEWHWMRWVLLAQPVIAALLLLFFA